MLLRAFAKINLELRILGKRADGFHQVRTVLQTIDWHDEIRLADASAFRFTASHGPQGESNLVVRAVRAFERETGIAVKLHVHLDKRVPTGAGLGGGSADAAVAFLGLQRFYQREANPAVLAQLGCDVPFFVHGGRALGTGRGDHIEPLDDEMDDERGYWIVLVHPRLFISTAQAYSWLTAPEGSPNIEGFGAQTVSDSGHAAPKTELKDELKNDFEGPVFARHAGLGEIRDDLLRMGAFHAGMSGSGSVMFGLFRDASAARQAASDLGGRYRPRDVSAVKVVRPLSRAEYIRRVFE